MTITTITNVDEMVILRVFNASMMIICKVDGSFKLVCSESAFTYFSLTVNFRLDLGRVHAAMVKHPYSQTDMKVISRFPSTIFNLLRAWFRRCL